MDQVIFRMISPIEQPCSITADSANIYCMHITKLIGLKTSILKGRRSSGSQ
jgi:hypothetical protein